MQVGIKECDRNLLLIRWWKEKQDGTWETVYYRFHRLPWGIISAPFVLNAVVPCMINMQRNPQSISMILLN